MIAAALCRWLADKNVRVAAFKSMAMADGDAGLVRVGDGPVHPHQLHQAYAARMTPVPEINPVVMSCRNGAAMVWLNGGGAITEHISIGDSNQELRAVILRAYAHICARHEHVLIEGCGSPTELNLLSRDLSNTWLAEMTGARCVLVASLERCGTFAAVVGTVELLRRCGHQRIVGYILNMFDGRMEYFKDGRRLLEQETGLPCLGIIPRFASTELLHHSAYATSAHVGVTAPPTLELAIQSWTSHVMSHLDLSLLETLLLPTSAPTTTVSDIEG